MEERVKKALQDKKVPEETRKIFDKFGQMKKKLEELFKEVESLDDQIYGDKTKNKEKTGEKCPKAKK